MGRNDPVTVTILDTEVLDARLILVVDDDFQRRGLVRVLEIRVKRLADFLEPCQRVRLRDFVDHPGQQHRDARHDRIVNRSCTFRHD